MKKQKINVIDLDNTLVPFDTFRKLVLREIKKGRFPVFYLTILRFLRIISASDFKMKVQNFLIKHYPEKFFNDFAREIYQEINPQVLEEVKNHSDDETTNILLSASPDQYVRELANLLHWKGKGSHFNENGNFCHLYGHEKTQWLQVNYPIEKYEYQFAVSDNKIDNNLLSLFSISILIRK